jgi:N6-L-threonylcarbamoyladenine synthase
LILAIETSCDDTCAAVLASDNTLLSNIVSSQDAFHARYGGIVPEIASRQHLRLINQVVAAALEEADVSLADISRVAVTTAPGLIGALLVGVATAKSFAAASGAELVSVNHLEGHIAANYLQPEPIEPPFICLIASGGHTSLVHVTGYGVFHLLGRTLDDAAGEALDKGARMLGLGYPGGAELDELAQNGNTAAVSFPVGLDRPGNFDFSFSGVKTALYYYLRDIKKGEFEQKKTDIAASYQAAVVESLTSKTLAAAEATSCSRICLSGGVSANTILRQRFTDECIRQGYSLRLPPRKLCTDNAAMIASAARYLPALPYPDYLSLGARAASGFGG